MQPDTVTDASALVFFLDESIGARLASTALRAAGVTVVMPGEEGSVAPGESDKTWLAFVGDRGGVYVTGDQKIKTRALERLAIQQHRVRTFVLVKKDMKGAQMAACLVAALPRMVALATVTPGPFIARITPGGGVVMTDWASLPVPAALRSL